MSWRNRQADRHTHPSGGVGRQRWWFQRRAAWRPKPRRRVCRRCGGRSRRSGIAVWARIVAVSKTATPGSIPGSPASAAPRNPYRVGDFRAMPAKRGPSRNRTERPRTTRRTPPGLVADPPRAHQRGLRVRRRLLQHHPPALDARLPLTRPVRDHDHDQQQQGERLGAKAPSCPKNRVHSTSWRAWDAPAALRDEQRPCSPRTLESRSSP